MLFDNNVYGLTKNQTSPTSPQGMHTNTHPHGAVLPPLNVLTAVLGFSNISFIAQTIDWHPAHLYATLHAAHRHRGLSFVRILQRCPTYTPGVFEELQQDPSLITLLTHSDGIALEPSAARRFTNQQVHAPNDLRGARDLAAEEETVPIGLLFHDAKRPRYESFTNRGLEMTPEKRLDALDQELDRFAV